MSGLRRFWFEFDIPEPAWPKGSGVTLDSPPGATLAQMYLRRGCLLEGEALPNIVRVTPDVDVSALDTGHVLPNIGVVVWRGVWWPGLNRTGPSEG